MWCYKLAGFHRYRNTTKWIVHCRVILQYCVLYSGRLCAVVVSSVAPILPNLESKLGSCSASFSTPFFFSPLPFPILCPLPFLHYLSFHLPTFFTSPSMSDLFPGLTTLVQVGGLWEHCNFLKGGPGRARPPKNLWCILSYKQHFWW